MSGASLLLLRALVLALLPGAVVIAFVEGLCFGFVLAFHHAYLMARRDVVVAGRMWRGEL